MVNEGLIRSLSLNKVSDEFTPLQRIPSKQLLQPCQTKIIGRCFSFLDLQFGVCGCTGVRVTTGLIGFQPQSASDEL